MQFGWPVPSRRRIRAFAAGLLLALSFGFLIVLSASLLAGFMPRLLILLVAGLLTPRLIAVLLAGLLITGFLSGLIVLIRHDHSFFNNSASRVHAAGRRVK